MITLSISATPLTQAALKFAFAAHKGQKRRYSQTPYIAHPMRVARMVLKATGDHELTAAALLHDVVEDTPITIADIEQEFGANVARIVAGVTTGGMFQGNRAERRRLATLRLKEAGAEAQTIKYADIADNCRDIVLQDPNFAELYLTEKLAQLKSLDQGNESLRSDAFCVVEAEIKRLEAMHMLAFV